MRQTHLLRLGAMVIGLSLLGAGCYGTKTTNTTTTNSAAVQTNTVSIVGRAFSPANITVTKGTTVTWTNNDTLDHTVTGDNGGPNSTLLTHGQSYPFTFDTVGTFTYHCGNHPDMTGTVTVTE